MNFYVRLLKDLLRSEDAVTSVEYAVVLAMILMAVVGAIGSVGSETGEMWDDIETDLENVGFIK